MVEGRRRELMRVTTSSDSGFIDFASLIVRGDLRAVSLTLDRLPALATMAVGAGATRQRGDAWFIREIAHYIYAGDTALHVAAAAFRRDVAEQLVRRGAACRARNRRGAEPLHYAADANRPSPDAQAETIAYLIDAGADPNARDNSGVAPLHRAVRTRSAAAVQALLAGGADVRQPNHAGSTPLHLAVQTTGRGGSGSPEARDQQAAIVTLLLARGGRTADRDGKGRTVREAASTDWARAALGH